MCVYIYKKTYQERKKESNKAIHLCPSVAQAR